MNIRLSLICIVFLIIKSPFATADDEMIKKTKYISEQSVIEESKLNKIIYGSVNVLFHLYEKRPELWTMDPLVRDRWIKNINDLVNDGLYSTRRIKTIIENNELLNNNSDKIRKLGEASEHLNQLRLAISGIKKNISAMRLGLSNRVGTVLMITKDCEEKEANDLFLNLNQAEDRLRMIMEQRVSLLEHLISAAPEILNECPTRSDIIPICCDIYLEPKVSCLTELKELVLRTNLSYDARCGAISRIIGFHNAAADNIDKRLDLVESSIPLAARLGKIIAESKKRK